MAARTALKGLFLFGASSLGAFILLSAIAVFLADQAHPAWGSWVTFQILCIVSLVATLMLLVGFGVGAAATRRIPRPLQATLLGAGCAAAFVVAVLIASSLQAEPADAWGILLLLPVLGGLSPFADRPVRS
jgi:hypothetical protein